MTVAFADGPLGASSETADRVASWDALVRQLIAGSRDADLAIEVLSTAACSAWKLLIGLSPASRVLDLGCGTGSHSLALAPHVAHVIALDSRERLLQIVRHRLHAHDAPGNVRIVAAGAASANLPFADGVFDLVLLSSLSAVAAAALGLPRQAGVLHHRALLHEVRRVLAPGGQVVWVTRNTCGYDWIASVPHEAAVRVRGLFGAHTQASPVSTGRTPPFVAERRLRGVGLQIVDRVALHPTYPRVREMTLPDGAAGKASPAGSMVGRLKRMHVFAPGHVVRASDALPLPQTLLSAVIAAIGGSPEPGGALTLGRLDITRKQKLVIRVTWRGRPAILKLPLDARGQCGEENNAAWLQRLQRIVPGLAPAPLASGSVQGQAYFLEEAARGHPLGSRAAGATRGTSAELMRQALVGLHDATVASRSCCAWDALDDALVEQPLRSIRAAIGEGDRCDRLGDHLRGVFRGRDWLAGIQHGDFSASNVFRLAGAPGCVIDWEYASDRGVPVLDALHYCESVQRLKQRGGSVAVNLRRLGERDWPVPEELTVIDALYRHLDIDPALHRPLCRLAWLLHMGRLLDTNARFRRRFLEAQLRAGLVAFTS